MSVWNLGVPLFGSCQGSGVGVLLMTDILHDPMYTILPEFPELWYVKSCRISIINTRLRSMTGGHAEPGFPAKLGARSTDRPPSGRGPPAHPITQTQHDWGGSKTSGILQGRGSKRECYLRQLGEPSETLGKTREYWGILRIP